MPPRLKVIKCNPKMYKGLKRHFNLVGSENATFVYHIDPKSFVIRDQLLISYNTYNKTVSIINKLNPSLTTKFSLENFGFLIIQFRPLNLYRGKIFNWFCRGSQSFTINVESSNMQRDQFSNRPISKQLPKALTVADQNLTTVKPYWKKQSDSARSKFSRWFRYNELSGLQTDFRLRLSFSYKLAMLKYLRWKLQLSSTELLKFNTNKGLRNSLFNSIGGLLVVSGVFANYTSVKNSISKGKIYLNGLLVRDFWVPVKKGDFILLLEKNNINVQNVTNACLEWNKGALYIKELPTATTFAKERSTQIKQLKGSDCKLQNPLNLVLTQGNLFVKRLVKV